MRGFSKKIERDQTIVFVKQDSYGYRNNQLILKIWKVAYTQENYNKVKDYSGIIVIQANCIDKSAKEIYELYK